MLNTINEIEAHKEIINLSSLKLRQDLILQAISEMRKWRSDLFNAFVMAVGCGCTLDASKLLDYASEGDFIEDFVEAVDYIDYELDKNNYPRDEASYFDKWIPWYILNQNDLSHNKNNQRSNGDNIELSVLYRSRRENDKDETLYDDAVDNQGDVIFFPQENSTIIKAVDSFRRMDDIAVIRDLWNDGLENDQIEIEIAFALVCKEKEIELSFYTEQKVSGDDDVSVPWYRQIVRAAVIILTSILGSQKMAHASTTAEKIWAALGPTVYLFGIGTIVTLIAFGAAKNSPVRNYAEETNPQPAFHEKYSVDIQGEFIDESQRRRSDRITQQKIINEKKTQSQTDQIASPLTPQVLNPQPLQLDQNIPNISRPMYSQKTPQNLTQLQGTIRPKERLDVQELAKKSLPKTQKLRDMPRRPIPEPIQPVLPVPNLVKEDLKDYRSVGNISSSALAVHSPGELNRLTWIARQLFNIESENALLSAGAQIIVKRGFAQISFDGLAVVVTFTPGRTLKGIEILSKYGTPQKLSSEDAALRAVRLLYQALQ